MNRNVRPCRCGAGSVIIVFEMDDWNRTRENRTIDCDVCLENERKETLRIEALRKKKEELHQQAICSAKERHLEDWLSRFEGLSKKKVWEKLPKNPWGYPSLGTFYTHSKDLDSYLTSYFESNTLLILENQIHDPEIKAILEKTKH